MSKLKEQVGGDHYKQFPIQPVEFCYVNKIPYLEATAIKYLCRWRDKGGVQDLEKAKHFIDLLIELENKYDKPTLKLDPEVSGLRLSTRLDNSILNGVQVSSDNTRSQTG